MSPARATNARQPAEESAPAPVRLDLVPSYGSIIDALNPMTKLGCLLAFCVVALFAPWPLAAAFALVVAVGAIASGRPGRVLRISLPIGLAFGLIAAGLRIIQSIGGAALTVPSAELTLGAAGDAFVRAVLVAEATTLLAATTDRRDVALDLERRGMPHGSALALVGIIAAGPAIAQRYRRIEDAQRARGLPLDAGWLARARGQVPLFFPTLVSSLHELGERSLALELRAVSRPGRRTLLWTPPELPWEPIAQIAAVLVSIAIPLARLTGWLG